ncbi:MgtC/SapB family protein [Thiolapillus sp.]
MTEQSLIAEAMSQIWFQFVLVAIFGFLTGLEFREYILLRSKELPEIPSISLGATRTFTFIAVLGFVLYLLDPELQLYLAGLLGLTLFFALFYYQKLRSGQPGLLQPLISLVVYTYGPAIMLQPPWFLVLLFVTIVFILSARPFTQQLTRNLEPQEISTLAKFLLLSGVILPLLPNHSISSYIPATPFKIWLAVVVISAISYAGYILKKYLLKRQGYLVTGLLGGLYSSTATTVVLARKSRLLEHPDAALNAGILAASGIMYLRLLALIAIMNTNLIPHTYIPLMLFSITTIAGAILIDRKAPDAADTTTDLGRSNPLELGIALLFAILFVVMMIITQQVINHFGQTGLNLLSFGVGFTDIDPFVLSILSGHYQATSLQQLSAAIIIAAGSNNLLKAVYAATLGGFRNSGRIAAYLLILGLGTIGYGLTMSAVIL